MYTPAITFTSSPLSAAMQWMALHENCNILRSFAERQRITFLTPWTPYDYAAAWAETLRTPGFQGIPDGAGLWANIKRGDTLHVNFDTNNSYDVHLWPYNSGTYLNEPGTRIVVASGGSHSGDSGYSLAGIADGTPYVVRVTNSSVTSLYETKADAVALPTLAGFADASTPTLAEWNALGTYSDVLYARSRVCLPGLWAQADKHLTPNLYMELLTWAAPAPTGSWTAPDTLAYAESLGTGGKHAYKFKTALEYVAANLTFRSYAAWRGLRYDSADNASNRIRLCHMKAAPDTTLRYLPLNGLTGTLWWLQPDEGAGVTLHTQNLEGESAPTSNDPGDGVARRWHSLNLRELGVLPGMAMAVMDVAFALQDCRED